MHLNSIIAGCLVGIVLSNDPALASEPGRLKGPTVVEVLASSRPGDWRRLDPENTLYMELPGGRVIIELAPAFAPRHVANVKALAREHYYDGLAVVRVQDNYVAQWADPDAEKPESARKIKTAQKTLAPEFECALNEKLSFTPLPDRDVYAREVGFSGGFPVARDRRSGKMWLVHTYGMVGAGRDNAPDSGGGTELYAVIGHAPRQLDRNVTLFGRVVQGMELLSALPRGTGPMGFYEKAGQRVPIKSIRVATDVPKSERTALEIMRTDTATFRKLIEARRNRREGWFQLPAGRLEIGNMPVPVRLKSEGPGDSPGRADSPFIPEIARVGAVQIGYSTQEDLAREWGEGKTIIGGHPNSGRVWQVKGTRWVIHTDGFDYSERGLVVDSLELLEDSELGKNAPKTRLRMSDFAWLEDVTPGMSWAQVRECLRKNAVSAKETESGFEVSAQGFHSLVGLEFKTWAARLDFAGDRLVRLAIDARP